MTTQYASHIGKRRQEARGPLIGTAYGHARVSTRETSLGRQIDALRGSGVEDARICRGKVSGRDFGRPAWRRLVGLLREGDLLVVKSIDRLGRDYDDIISEWRCVTKELGADIVVLDMALLDTRGPERGVTGTLISDIVLQLLSYVAQVEREGIRQRQVEGIASVKARGVRFGRPPKPKLANWEGMRDDFLAGRITRGEAAARLGASPTTFGRWLMGGGAAVRKRYSIRRRERIERRPAEHTRAHRLRR